MAEETPRFSKENDVLTDTQTTLEWQDDYSDNGDSIKYAQWTDTIDYCETLSLNSPSDWRLANKKELLSIVDYDAVNPPAISSVFENTTFNYYGSSTTHPNNTNLAWGVKFDNGYMRFSYKSNSFYVRCVRAGQ